MNSMNPVAYIALFSGVINIFIGSYVFLLNPKKNVNKVFAFLVLLIAVFCIAEFAVRISETQEFALFFGRVGYSLLALISCLGIHFSLVFPRKYPIFLQDTNIHYLLYIWEALYLLLFSIYWFLFKMSK